jgi:hypothetical protein
MNRLFRNAVIINILLLVAFIGLSILTWWNVMDRLNYRVMQEGYHSEGIVRVDGIYYDELGCGMNTNLGSLGSANYTLYWFILTVAINLYLVWRAVHKLSEIPPPR